MDAPPPKKRIFWNTLNPLHNINSFLLRRDKFKNHRSKN